MRRFLVSLMMGAALAAQAPDPFAPVRFLAGEWVGEGAGDPGRGEGAFSFRFDLDGKVLVRRSHADYPAREGRPALRHEDLMTVFAEAGSLKALYLDNEGHAIRYRVEALAGGGAAFTSEPGPGPAFRLTYVLRPDGAVRVVFAIAPPDRPEAFKTYVEGLSRRR